MDSEDEKIFVEQLEGMEKEFAKQTNLLNQTATQLQETRSENILLRKKVDLLGEENKRMIQMISSSNKMLGEHLDFAAVNVQLQKQREAMASQLQEEQLNFSRSSAEMSLDCKLKQEEMDSLRNMAKLHESNFNAQIEASKQKYDQILAEKEQLLQELQREVAFQCQQRTYMEVHFSEQLSSLNKCIVEKNKELQIVRKEFAELSQSHEQQLQKARMKYEEHLLSVVQASNTETQYENWRRKMLMQKQEAENEISSLRRKIQQLESNQPPLRKREKEASMDFFAA